MSVSCFFYRFALSLVIIHFRVRMYIYSAGGVFDLPMWKWQTVHKWQPATTSHKFIDFFSSSSSLLLADVLYESCGKVLQMHEMHAAIWIRKKGLESPIYRIVFLATLFTLAAKNSLWLSCHPKSSSALIEWKKECNFSFIDTKLTNQRKETGKIRLKQNLIKQIKTIKKHKIGVLPCCCSNACACCYRSTQTNKINFIEIFRSDTRSPVEIYIFRTLE